MRNVALSCIALMTLALVPSIASGDRYDRGDRYRGGDHYYRGHDHNHSSFNVSFGFGNGGYSDYSYVNFGYSSGYNGYHRPYYYPRYYAAPVSYCAPPPVYYAPVRAYYYNDCYRPSYYCRPSRYSYCR